MRTFIKLCICLLIALPISVMAGEQLSDRVNTIVNWGFWPIFFAALFGGITATFIRTEVDSQLKHDGLSKLIIGLGLGMFACISWQAHDPSIDTLKLALPAFVLGSLGAPIRVFLLTWASDPKTRLRAGAKLNSKLGFGSEDNNSNDTIK